VQHPSGTPRAAGGRRRSGRPGFYPGPIAAWQPDAAISLAAVRVQLAPIRPGRAVPHPEHPSRTNPARRLTRHRPRGSRPLICRHLQPLLSPCRELEAFELAADGAAGAGCSPTGPGAALRPTKIYELVEVERCSATTCLSWNTMRGRANAISPAAAIAAYSAANSAPPWSVMAGDL
jgi:hypothetical protein